MISCNDSPVIIQNKKFIGNNAADVRMYQTPNKNQNNLIAIFIYSTIRVYDLSYPIRIARDLHSYDQCTAFDRLLLA
jgi:hypothetical protein